MLPGRWEALLPVRERTGKSERAGVPAVTQFEALRLEMTYDHAPHEVSINVQAGVEMHGLTSLSGPDFTIHIMAGADCRCLGLGVPHLSRHTLGSPHG